MYEDSIQELNNLIGELDSFQREHEQKMKQKKREQVQNESMPQTKTHDAHNTTANTTLTTSSIGDMSDIYNNFDKLSISSSDPNPMMCSTATDSCDMAFGDGAKGLHDIIDCQATTMSLKLNLSTTEYPLIMHNSSNSILTSNASSIATNNSNGSGGVQKIELITDCNNVSDDYVKEHTEIVVLRRKDSQNEVTTMNDEISAQNYIDTCDGAKNVERISSFRCSSFSKINDGKSTLRRGQSITSAESLSMAHRSNANDHFNGMTMAAHKDQDVVDNADHKSATTQMIRQKPVITPRPASLSGLFQMNYFFFLFFYYIKIPSKCRLILFVFTRYYLNCFFFFQFVFINE